MNIMDKWNPLTDGPTPPLMFHIITMWMSAFSGAGFCAILWLLSQHDMPAMMTIFPHPLDKVLFVGSALMALKSGSMAINLIRVRRKLRTRR